MTDQRNSNVVFPIVAFLAAMLAVYVGAYYAKVDSTQFSSVRSTRVRYLPDYGRGHRWLNPLFAPIHEIDRRIRPGVWSRPLEEIMVDPV